MTTLSTLIPRLAELEANTNLSWKESAERLNIRRQLITALLAERKALREALEEIKSKCNLSSHTKFVRIADAALSIADKPL